ncbi:MAG TPA: hypothetical protein VNL91_07930 [Thermoanaerobaculia bacterium]|nr:hypothetical protein [Thermoanaerobaculia bacterium]
MTRVTVIALLLASIACQPGGGVRPRPGRQVDATVITIRTVTEPPRKEVTSTIAIAGDVARASDELDEWRLFHLTGGRVTFVDDVARSFRSETLASLLQKRRAILARDPGSGFPDVHFTATGERRTILGVDAARALIRAGGYQRELWIGSHPSIPPQLFAMMHISRLPTSAIAGMAKQADESLSSVRGFPLIDRSEIALGGDGKLVAERTVVKVEKRKMPLSYFRVPPAYRDEDAERREARNARRK